MWAKRRAVNLAVALDAAGKVHFNGDSAGGDHMIMICSRGVPDSHLAELAADKVLVAPALDAGEAAERIVLHPEGLAGLTRLSFGAAEPLEHGAVLLTYRVTSP
jgi:hypothetical protein